MPQHRSKWVHLHQYSPTMSKNPSQNLSVEQHELSPQKQDDGAEKNEPVCYHIELQDQICIFKFNNKSKDQKMGNNWLAQQRNKEELSIDPPHCMLNNTKVLQKDGRAILKAQWPFFTKEIYAIWEKEYIAFLQRVFEVQSLENVRQPLSKHLLLPLSHSYTEVNVCTPTGIVTMEYELPGKSLIADVEGRSFRNEPYSQHQIWILIFQLSKIVSFLQQQSIAAGDVRSQNIFVDFQRKNLKIATEVSWIGQPKFVNKIATNTDVFVAPEMLLEKKQNKQLKRSMFKTNDDFSIGMTIAECILLQDLSKVYEINGGKRVINKQKMSELIERLLKIKYYSLKLLLMVVGMIQTKPINRISCHEVCQLLKHSKKEIVGCLPFELTKQKFIRHVPEKYNTLQKIIDDIKLRSSRLGLDREGYASRMLSIGSISVIKNDKRHEDETFNYDVAELSINTHSKPTQSSQKDSSHHPDKSVINRFSSKQESNILREGYNTSEVEQNSAFLENWEVKPRYRQAARKNSGSSGKKLQYLKLDQIWATSGTKQYQRNTFSNARQPEHSLKYNGLYEQDPKLASNFSFHSPESLEQQVPEEERQDDISHNTAINKLQNDSVSRSTETLLLMPSVYNVSNPPQSYISYHYTKSITPNDRKLQAPEEKDECMSFETKVFHFEKDLPDNVMLRKKSEECYPYQDESENKGYAYKRSTLGANCSGYRFGGHRHE